MNEFERDILQKFDVVINYYSNVNPPKAQIYSDIKKEYYGKIEAFAILPDIEKERIQNIEEVISNEIEHIRLVEER